MLIEQCSYCIISGIWSGGSEEGVECLLSNAHFAIFLEFVQGVRREGVMLIEQCSYYIISGIWSGGSEEWVECLTSNALFALYLKFGQGDQKRGLE